MRHRPRIRHRAGFTLVELLMVVVIIMGLTFIAYPSLSTFKARDGGLEAAGFTARLLNQVKSQARQRNRAYVVRFRAFNAALPRGMVEVLEGNSNSCLQVVTELASRTTLLRRYLYGQEPPPDGSAVNDTSGTVAEVGLSGWLPPGADAGEALRAEELMLCVKTDGAIVDTATLQPLAGRLRVVVQRFDGDGAGWRPAEPGRAVAVTFAGQARLELN